MIHDLKALPVSAPAVRSRCEPSRSLFDNENPMPWNRGPTILGMPPQPSETVPLMYYTRLGQHQLRP